MTPNPNPRPATVLAALWLAATGLAPSRADEPETITYREVKAVLKSQCFKCHSPEERRGRLDMTTYGALMRGSLSGPIVVKGNPDESLLYLVVTHQEEPRMPPGSPKMPDDRLELIRRWIAAGAPERPGDTPILAAPAPSTESAMAAPSMSATAADRGKAPAASAAKAEVKPNPKAVRPTPLTALASSPDGKRLAVSDQSRILLLDVGPAGLTARAAFPFPEGEVYALRFGRDANRLLAAGGQHAASGAAVLFDAETGRRLGRYGDESDVVLAADLSPNLEFVAVGGPSRVVKVFHAETGTLKHVLKRHTDWVLSVAYSPDGLLVATCDRAGNTFVWEAENGREVHALRGHNAAVTALAWDATGDRLFTSGDDGLVNAWDMHKGSLIRSWRADAKGVLGLATAPGGSLAAGGRGGTVRLWTDAGGEAAKPLGPFDDIPALVAPTAGGRWAVADWAGHLSLWDASGTRLGRYEPIHLTARELASGPATVVSSEEVESTAASTPAPRGKAPAEARSAAGLSDDARAAEQALTALLTQLRDQQRKLREDEEAVLAADARLKATGTSTLVNDPRLERVSRSLTQASADLQSLFPASPTAPSRELNELAVLIRLATERAGGLAPAPADAKALRNEAVARLESTRRDLRKTLDRINAVLPELAAQGAPKSSGMPNRAGPGVATAGRGQ